MYMLNFLYDVISSTITHFPSICTRALVEQRWKLSGVSWISTLLHPLSAPSCQGREEGSHSQTHQSQASLSFASPWKVTRDRAGCCCHLWCCAALVSAGIISQGDCRRMRHELSYGMQWFGPSDTSRKNDVLVQLIIWAP